ncbi:MAG TPA: STAS domain-containing protein [Deltaproteobacteria bacterium]|nr:STAS domain-containing protein [Deltaproteobacteria bacterium]HPR53511.1 STAS domain-containing protein [Deltaproteobacteria bacterium]HXK46152.1 STAS domain-containing protein [Deltaproteobacteria bacterium]
MEIIIDRQGAIVCKGNLVVSDIENIHSSLESLLEDSSQVITLDLDGVEEIDISGLQLLYSLKKTFDADGAMRIRAINPAIREIIEISGFSIALKEALP